MIAKSRPGSDCMTKSELIVSLTEAYPHLALKDLDLIVTAVFLTRSAQLWREAIAWSCAAWAPSRLGRAQRAWHETREQAKKSR
jgi:hypothetical protein